MTLPMTAHAHPGHDHVDVSWWHHLDGALAVAVGAVAVGFLVLRMRGRNADSKIDTRERG